LANIKSQIKRNRQNKKLRINNRVVRGTARSFVRKAKASIQAGNAKEAHVETLKAIKALDRAASKGVIHKNKAARSKARLMKRLNSM